MKRRKTQINMNLVSLHTQKKSLVYDTQHEYRRKKWYLQFKFFLKLKLIHSSRYRYANHPFSLSMTKNTDIKNKKTFLTKNSNQKTKPNQKKQSCSWLYYFWSFMFYYFALICSTYWFQGICVFGFVVEPIFNI